MYACSLHFAQKTFPKLVNTSEFPTIAKLELRGKKRKENYRDLGDKNPKKFQTLQEYLMDFENFFLKLGWVNGYRILLYLS